MNTMNHKILSMLTMILLLPGMQGTVLAEESTHPRSWVLVGDSPLLDRSSKAMYKGKHSLGIKYANRALDRSQSPYTALIAHHNLCIAYSETGEEDMALRHCGQALEQGIPTAYLKKIKDGLYKVRRLKAAGTDAFRLDTLIARNLESVKPRYLAQLQQGTE